MMYNVAITDVPGTIESYIFSSATLLTLRLTFTVLLFM